VGLRAAFAIALSTLALVVGAASAPALGLRPGQSAPEIAAGRWINSAPLTIAGLRGRVIAVEFWTFG
jgi:hypothetical protein